jgi:hypothetical protein
MDRARVTVVAVLVCLAASAVTVAAAPLLMPESYSWVAHTTSESAAQGVTGAWLARLGFASFGIGVAALSVLARARWGSLATSMHVAFGILMVAAAAFSARSWDPAVAFDPTEDVLHSAAATGMGFAFAFGVAAAAWRARSIDGRLRMLDVVAVAASVVLPLGMMAMGELAGLLQRLMFAIAYGWYGVEASRVYTRSGREAAPRRAARLGER